MRALLRVSAGEIGANRAERRREPVRPHDAGQLNVSRSVPEKRAPLLNALGSSLPAGLNGERERRPERPRRALCRARGALCANAVNAPVVLPEPRRPRKRGGKSAAAPEIALRGRCKNVPDRVSATPLEWLGLAPAPGGRSAHHARRMHEGMIFYTKTAKTTEILEGSERCTTPGKTPRDEDPCPT